jgi:hypothetical protein
MTNEQDDIKRIMKLVGKRGGDKTKASKPADYYSKIGKIGSAKRWNTKNK